MNKKEQLLPPVDYGRTIIGFHGTDIKTAEKLCHGELFKQSHNDYDWLGNGIYFWEYAPIRAWQWAKERFSDNAIVVAALIRLGYCFDLLDPINTTHLNKSYLNIVENHPYLKNIKGAKRLDCAVFNYFFDLAKEKKIEYDTVRGMFVETSPEQKEPIWPGSGVIKDAHIQVSVRNLNNIISVWPIRHDGSFFKNE